MKMKGACLLAIPFLAALAIAATPAELPVDNISDEGDYLEVVSSEPVQFEPESDIPSDRDGKRWKNEHRKTYTNSDLEISMGGNAQSQNPMTQIFQSRRGCGQGEKKVKFEYQGDKYAVEDKSAWKIVRKNQNRSDGPVVLSADFASFADGRKVKTMCLPVGLYEIVVVDLMGDGVCCFYDNGAYKLYMESGNGSWEQLIIGGNFKKKTFSHGFQIRMSDPSMSKRDAEWLTAHNKRRIKYHRKYGKTPALLKWDKELADGANKYANELLATCGDSGIEHDPNNKYGENMAKNRGPAGSWGELKPADNILTRMVEYEEFWAYPKNFHLVQVLWMATKYVGCGDAVTKWGKSGAGRCRIQVCRYAKVGNCAINPDTWKEKMLLPDSPCYPDVPPNGAF